MLNIIKYDFGIEVRDSVIFSIVYYMEKIGALLPQGAYFSVIYPAMVKLIEMKTGLKLKVKKSSITAGLDDVSMWGLGFKRLSSLSLSLSSDGYMSKEDIKKIALSKKGSGHNHVVKLGNKSNKWIIVDSWGGKVYKTSLDALKEGVRLGVYYDTARTLVAADARTRRVQLASIKKAKENGKLNMYK